MKRHNQDIRNLQQSSNNSSGIHWVVWLPFAVGFVIILLAIGGK